MELLLVVLIVIAAVAFLGRGRPTWYRRGPRTVVRPDLRRRVADDAVVGDEVLADEPVRHRRTTIDEY
ncbi:MAG TPA: hypothetical protein VM942_01895 [Acidimicrobiales bacterium]|nr:hypothetical protein [Acidimicrobiales bacterium]